MIVYDTLNYDPGQSVKTSQAVLGAFGEHQLKQKWETVM